MDNTYIADIHSHILPGVDDGAGDPETSAKLLSKAYEEGTRILFFTPHYQRGRNKYKPQDLDALYNAIAKVIGSRWPDMKLCLGNEVYYEPGIKEDLKAGLIHTMAGTRYVLVEFSRNTSVKNVFRAVREVTADGHKMIVAHVERYPALVEDRESMEKLKDMGVLFQMNAEALRKKGFFAGKELKDLKIVMNGAGAAGIRICEMCKAAGVVDVTMCDSKGTIRRDRTDLNPYKARHAVDTTAKTLKEAIVGADVFIGVSAANVLSGEDVAKMGEFPAIFAMANPDPEIAPEEVAKALKGRKYVMVTGRSDYPNQINNVLGFPYLFRGALDVRATTINTEMKVAAANALAMLARESVPDDVKALYPDETLEFGTGYIIPKPFDRRLKDIVPAAVAEAARRTGVARL